MQASAKYIAIEGVIGVGKTTLALMLSKRLNARVALEEFEDNPFLERFYENQERYAFQTQMSFLTTRYKQQQQLRNLDLFYEYLITDYIFDKDKIFAYLNLQDDELRLYETIVNFMDKTVTQPDLVVYLQSTPERLMQNIKKRNRQFEQMIQDSYIRDLHDAYNYFFFRYKKTPLLIINTTELDFANSDHDFNLLYDLICNKTHSGTEYFNPEKKLYEPRSAQL
ncbi:MAG: deoxyadenosine kinase [[Candidatus Thermochlorobacteriaceae] bacterium GBChlB]|jgi:deoxyadenosine/deoxycytidine kinase|nr:MAG: deoxyadenosine kinase [[Candidatus Thermochlorobacteriaceae] bacterium GBChlB]